MNVSSKEKKIIIILGIILGLTLYINFLFIPQIKKISQDKKALSAVQDTLRQFQIIQKRIEAMFLQFNSYKKKLEQIRINYPTMLYHEDIFVAIKDAARLSGVSVDNAQFGVLAALPENPGSNNARYTSEEDNKSIPSIALDPKLLDFMNLTGISFAPKADMNHGAIQDGKGFYLNVSLGVSGNYFQIKDFIKTVEGMTRKTNFNTVTLASSSNGVMTATCQIQFFGIMDRKVKVPKKAFVSEEDKMLIQPNPALEFNLEQKELTEEQLQNQIAEEKEFDINAIAKAVSANVQSTAVTFMNVGGEEYQNQKPTISASNPGTEIVKMYFEERDGAVYFRARTTLEQFPDENPTNLAELITTSKNIKMQIASEPRIGNLDLNATEFNITNKTERKILIKLSRDDKTNPRVKFSGDMENVIVSYTEE